MSAEQSYRVECRWLDGWDTLYTSDLERCQNRTRFVVAWSWRIVAPNGAVVATGGPSPRNY